MRFSNHQIICVCIFSAMWGAIEIFVGTLLHQIPGKPIPTAMTIMIFLIPILTILYEITKSAKAILFAGFIVAVLKLFSPGGVKFTPFVSIMIEVTTFALVFQILPDRLKKTKIFIAGIFTGANGSVIGSLAGSFIFGYFNGKTAKYILIFTASKFGTGLLGGIIGSIIAVLILKKLQNHQLFTNRNKNA